MREKPGSGLTIARASILTHSSTAAVRGSVVVVVIVVIFCLVLFLLLSFWNAEKNGKYNNSFESHISLMYTHNRLRFPSRQSSGAGVKVLDARRLA